MSGPTGTYYTNLGQKDRARINKLFDVSLQGSNGDSVYDRDKVHGGYLSPDKYLVVRKVTWEHAENVGGYNVSLKDFGSVNGHLNYLGASGGAYKNGTKFLMGAYDSSGKDDNNAFFWHTLILNYDSLKAAGVATKSAAYAAMFRARWVQTGALAFLAKSTTDAASEVKTVEDNDKDYGAMFGETSIGDILDAAPKDVTSLMTVVMASDGGLEWVMKHSENMWAAVEHTFRVRSHHFKNTGDEADAYENLYTTYLNACFEGEFSVPDGFNWFDVAHTAIHPFKIEALPKTTAHYLAYGMIADAAIVRLSGAPVGNAILTTTSAAMGTMASEIWYSSFKLVYKNELNDLEDVTSQICDDKYSYHLAAVLYGMTKKESVTLGGKTITLNDAKTKLSVLGASAAGLIDALHSAKESYDNFTFALSNAKSLRKASADNPLMSIKVRELIIRAVADINEAKDLPKAIVAALPRAQPLPAAAQPAGSASSTSTTP